MKLEQFLSERQCTLSGVGSQLTNDNLSLTSCIVQTMPDYFLLSLLCAKTD